MNQSTKKSPTSFLNAVSLEQGKKGDKLFLVSNSIGKTVWVKSLEHTGSLPYATAIHEGSQIRLKKNGQQDVLISNKETRSHEFETKGGKFAKIYHGRKHGKIWAYIFDPGKLKTFKGFKFYLYNEKAFVDATFKPVEPVIMQHRTFQGDSATARKIGVVSFKYLGQKHDLSAYNWQKKGEETGFALIFTDNTSGKETYGGDRELSVKIDNLATLKTEKQFKIDFNKTINFSCAHNPFWHCPVGLQENLPTSVLAGELLPNKI